jgi:hypothetical protein
LPFDPLKRGFAFKYWGFMGTLRWLAMAGSEQQLTAPATGFGLPFALAGEAPSSIIYNCEHVLTMVVLQCGKQRRTSLRRIDRRNEEVFRTTGGCGTCRISGGPEIEYTRHQHQILLSLLFYLLSATVSNMMRSSHTKSYSA